MAHTLENDLSWLAENFYFPLQPAIRKEKTRVQYRCALRSFAESLGHRPKLEDLTDENILAMIYQLRQKKLAEKTVCERRGRINALWTWLRNKGKVQTAPTIKALKIPKRIPRAWSKEELAKLIAACDRETKPVGGIPGALWWRAMHAVLWDTGHRIGALMEAKIHDLRPGGWLILPAETIKGERVDMAHRLHPKTVELLLAMTPRGTALFPWPYDRSTLYNRYTKILERAGLSHLHLDKFHKMRRSMASHLEAAGGNATTALGHSSRSVTIACYLDPTIVGQESPIDRLFRLEDSA